MERDEAAIANEAVWDREVERGVGSTGPWLDLDRDMLCHFARGDLADAPERLIGRWPCPGLLLGDVEGKDVLCLGTGGGQQSAVYGLLGARVTVADLSRRQLEGDHTAAAHYGYEIRTIHADMRDLSCLDDECFDVVDAMGMCYVPDLQRVYCEIARVLRPGGRARVNGGQPAVFDLAWDGEAYRIAKPYCERVNRRADGGIEYRHYIHEKFNGLLDVGLSIRRVLERVRKPDPQARPGSWTHQAPYVGGGFIIVATKDGPACRRAGRGTLG